MNSDTITGLLLVVGTLVLCYVSGFFFNRSSYVDNQKTKRHWGYYLLWMGTIIGAFACGIFGYIYLIPDIEAGWQWIFDTFFGGLSSLR